MTSLSDLEPIYESKCDIHSKIIFCKNNKKGGKVLKYKIDNDTKSWQLVQCLCCQFEEKSMNEEWINSIKQQMDIDKSIDETNNRLSIQPFFSRFCQNTQKISIFASVWPEMNTILAWNFDIEKETFVRSECSKECCQQIVYPNDMTPPSVFDIGARGKQFARYHSDLYGNQLICLSITWYDDQNGQIEYFLDSEGDIGRYEWKNQRKFFEFMDLLDIKTLSHKYPEQIDIKKPIELLYDLNFILLDTKKCETLDDVIYFCSQYTSSLGYKVEKFIFDPMNLQFCRIECSCCTTSKDEKSRMDGYMSIAIYDSCITNTKASIQTDWHGNAVKVITTPCGNNVQFGISKVRNYSHLSPEEIKYRRRIEEKTPKMTQVFQKKLTKKISKFSPQVNEYKRDSFTEAWILKRNRLASDGVTNMITYVYMDGSVKEKAEEVVVSENILKTNPDERILEMNRVFRRDQDNKAWQNWEFYNEKLIKNCDLSVKYRNYCKHTGHFIITAFNNNTEETGHYVFNPETAQFHHCDYCPQCPPYENGAEIHPYDLVMAVETSKSTIPLCIRTNQKGGLLKIRYDVHGGYQLLSSKIEKKVENINEIRNSIRADDVIEIPTCPQSPLDSDLIPKYRFYCEHIKNVIIKALNNHSRDFYIFNSTTGHLEQRKDCPDCHGVHEKDIKPLEMIMSTMSPYSKWPIMLRTDKSGNLYSVYFRLETNSFERMAPLSVNMRMKKERNTSTQMKNMDSCLASNEDNFKQEEWSDEEDEWFDEEDQEQKTTQSVDKKCEEKENGHKDEEEKTDEKDSKENLVPDCNLTPKYRNYCNHTNHFIITALNHKTKETGHYVFNPETAQFHQCNYCPMCPSYENGEIPKSNKPIMTFETLESKFPYRICRDYVGRLTTMGFDSKIKNMKSIRTKTQKKVENINEIKNSIKTDTIEIPTAQQSPLNSDLTPKYKFYCPHINDFPIIAVNNYTKTRGFYVYNSTTGHMDQTTQCRKCSHKVYIQPIHPMRNFMTVMSPYSKWPIVLTTDESGRLMSLGFQLETNSFERMPPLSINMRIKKKKEKQEAKINDNISEKAEDDSKPTSTPIEPAGIDDDQSSIGSDFSYLQSDLVDKLPEQEGSEQFPQEEVIQEQRTETVETNTCIIL